MSRTIEELERDAFLAEGEALAQLLQHPAWPRYEKLLHAMRLSSLEEMAKTNVAEFPRWQGIVAVLQEIIERPHQIVATARAVAAEEAHAKPSARQALDFVDGPVTDEL